MIPYLWIEQARERVAAHIRHTPLTFDSVHNCYLKWENQQITGSFKARGALNKILALQKWEQERGIVAASAGNHGQGVALAGKFVGAKVIVFVSEHAVPAKVEAMRRLDADVRMVSGGYDEAENAGKEYAKQSGATWVSPYNDGLVIAGQATLVEEVLQEQPILAQATWLVPASGGGLISGIAVALKERVGTVGCRVIGIQTEASPFLHGLFYRGTQDGLVELPSMADGLAGPVEAGSITIPIVRRYVDDFILINEHEIKEAIRFSWEQYEQRTEASAAVSLAAIMQGKISQRPVVAVISGGNIQPEVYTQIIEGNL